MGGLGPLARLFPSDNVMPAEGQLSLARLELFDAVAALVERLTAAHPVVLVLDDMHWATLPTVLLLQHLVDQARDRRVQIIVTFREGDLDTLHPVRNLLPNSQLGVRNSTVELASLTAADVAQMVSAAAPAASITKVAEIAELVCSESAGNPFFDTQTSWMLQTGLISFHAGTFGQMVNAAQAMTAGAHSHLWTSAHALALMFNGDHAAAKDLLD